MSQSEEVKKSSMNIVDLTTIINRYEGDIKKTKEALKIQNSMMRDAVEGDAAYHELDMQMKDIKKKMNEIKERIMKTTAMEAVVAKIEEYKSELSDAKSMLSGYLEEYQRVAGTNIIEGEDGEIKVIVSEHKLVGRRSG